MLPSADYLAILPAPFGALGVRMRDESLTGLDFLPPGSTPRVPDDIRVARLAAELAAYYADPGHVFGLPIELSGTPFRLRVWAAIQAISAGETRTYGEIARALGSGPRAVGQAVGDNPLPILVPCHRVLAAGGLGGFMHGAAGFPLVVKRWLLRHEGVAV